MASLTRHSCPRGQRIHNDKEFESGGTNDLDNKGTNRKHHSANNSNPYDLEDDSTNYYTDSDCDIRISVRSNDDFESKRGAAADDAEEREENEEREDSVEVTTCASSSPAMTAIGERKRSDERSERHNEKELYEDEEDEEERHEYEEDEEDDEEYEEKEFDVRKRKGNGSNWVDGWDDQGWSHTLKSEELSSSSSSELSVAEVSALAQSSVGGRRRYKLVLTKAQTAKYSHDDSGGDDDEDHLLVPSEEDAQVLFRQSIGEEEGRDLLPPLMGGGRAAGEQSQAGRYSMCGVCSLGGDGGLGFLNTIGDFILGMFG